MRYYLETNALRNLGKNLLNITSDSFTSAFSLFELVSGLTEQEYNKRKAIISHTFNSKIEIIWKFPIQIKAEAFPTVGYFLEYRIKDLKFICEALMECSNYDSFTKYITSSYLKYDHEFFKILDNASSDHLVNTTDEGNIKVHSLVTNEAEKFTIDNLLYNPLNNQITLYSISEDISDGLKISNVYERDKVFNSYNGSINIYIYAVSYYYGDKLKTKSSAGKNDYADLEHLIYLGSDQNISIATNDRLIIYLLEKTNFGTAINPKDVPKMV